MSLLVIGMGVLSEFGKRMLPRTAPSSPDAMANKRRNEAGMSPRTGDDDTPELTEDDMEDLDQIVGGMGTGGGEDPMGDHGCPDCGALPGEECLCNPSCEECGAPEGHPHEGGCPNEEHDDPRDPDRAWDSRGDQMEGKKEAPVNEFDKFMDRIVIEERSREKVNPLNENNPRRQQASRYQDRPMNKTRFVRGGR